MPTWGCSPSYLQLAHLLQVRRLRRWRAGALRALALPTAVSKEVTTLGVTYRSLERNALPDSASLRENRTGGAPIRSEERHQSLVVVGPLARRAFNFLRPTRGLDSRRATGFGPPTAPTSGIAGGRETRRSGRDGSSPVLLKQSLTCSTSISRPPDTSECHLPGDARGGLLRQPRPTPPPGPRASCNL